MFWPSADTNRVSSPTPWRREIWEALREAAESEDLGRKQRILDVNNIRLGNRDMTICYDDSGTFILHVCILYDDEHDVGL
ncbi:putative DC-UbP/UBTD2 domain-containing protein [Helianthus anomalus]